MNATGKFVLQMIVLVAVVYVLVRVVGYATTKRTPEVRCQMGDRQKGWKSTGMVGEFVATSGANDIRAGVRRTL